MAESTHLDALVADMLGDIGKLHDRIKALPVALEESLTPTVGVLLAAGKEYETKLRIATRESVKEAQVVVKRDAAQARNEALGDIKAAAREAVSAPINDLVNGLNVLVRDLRMAVARVDVHRRDTLWQSLMVGAASGVLCTILVLGVVHYAIGYPTDSTALVTLHKKGK